MALKTFNPTTPGQRQLIIVDRSTLHKGKPVKALTEGKLSNGGRNNTGRLVVRFRGGGHKKAYRIVDFKRAKLGLTSALIIDGAELEANFALAARNIPNIDVLPVQGINVYDILRRPTLVLTKSALEALEARFK